VTMATSSGEEAWYVTDPSSFVTGVTWKAFFIISSEWCCSINLRYDITRGTSRTGEDIVPSKGTRLITQQICYSTQFLRQCTRPDDSVGNFDVVHDEVNVHSFPHIQIDT
jgi:hypothetical protein